MKFRTWLEAGTNITQVAGQIAQDYNADRTLDLTAAFDRHTAGLTDAEKDQVYAVVVHLAKNKTLRLRPVKNGRYRGELQQYVSDMPDPQPPKQLPEPQRTVLDEIAPLVQKPFVSWLAGTYDDVPEGDNLDHLQEFLEDRYGIEVRPDGLISFSVLTGAMRRLVGDRDVVVYHHTSSALDRKVAKMGLRPGGTDGVKKVNPHLNSGAGVYVTTETSGPAVHQYHSMAVRQFGGKPRTYVIRTTLAELADDPDDQDLSVGKHQYVLPYVQPGDIVEKL